MLKAIIEMYPEVDWLIADGFDEAIIGVDVKDYRIIYSVTKCLDILISQGMDEFDAIEYFDFNVRDAYMGVKTPIWSDDIL